MPKSQEEFNQSAYQEQLDFLNKFPEAVQIFFAKNDGELDIELDKPTIQDERSRLTEYALVSNEQDVEKARQEIIESSDGWKKRYLCATTEIAHSLHKDMAKTHYSNSKGL